MIQSLNLHNSVKNITLHICFRERDTNDNNFSWYFEFWKIYVTNLLNKKDYFNLTNLNILIDCTTLIFDWNGRSTADWIFGILKNNVKVLQYQFVELNIGLRISKEFFRSDVIECQSCYVFEWDSTVNEKFLDECKQFIRNQSAPDRKLNVKKFRKLINQWV